MDEDCKQEMTEFLRSLQDPKFDFMLDKNACIEWIIQQLWDGR